MTHFKRSGSLIIVAGFAFALQGCVARTAFDVVSAPVKIVGKAVDLATVSQSEKDEKRGRELRESDERLGSLERLYGKQRAKCEKGDGRACEKARATYAELASETRRSNGPT